ncbi:hypothetical protein PIB30_040850 [Stylosanthes scabra]|uniref:F-box domain-containing protein n=1 Tax=Stylosanthes scabra TaxID=79078 RepID=A0ABU6ZDF3_9FABA|nr:hypothetical protein [Stylosanthes scabra]
MINTLPPDLLQEILLRLTVHQLGFVKLVCKLWKDLISEPSFAKTHYERSLAPTHRCIFIPQYTNLHVSIDLDALSHVIDANAAAATTTEITPCSPLKGKDNVSANDYCIILGSCRGFIALYHHPHFFIIWNPLTRTHRTIPCHTKFPNNNAIYGHGFTGKILFGFGYDAIRDDYLVVVYWNDDEEENEKCHFDFFSLRSNSWSSFKEDGVTISDELKRTEIWARSWLFLNGAIHWLHHDIVHDATATIFVFDTSQRKWFTEIPVLKQVGKHYPCHFRLLGECLALCYANIGADDDATSVIWVMKEYNVQFSWTSYDIPSRHFKPLWLSDNGDFIGFDRSPRLSKYNDIGELLLSFDSAFYQHEDVTFAVYTESLLSLPNDSYESEEKEEGYVKLFFHALLCAILALLLLLYAIMNL